MVKSLGSGLSQPVFTSRRYHLACPRQVTLLSLPQFASLYSGVSKGTHLSGLVMMIILNYCWVKTQSPLSFLVGEEGPAIPPTPSLPRPCQPLCLCPGQPPPHCQAALVQLGSGSAGFSSQRAVKHQAVLSPPHLSPALLGSQAPLCQTQPACSGRCVTMPSIFAYQSSEVDWCESNFQHSELVAEFYNTVRASWAAALGVVLVGAESHQTGVQSLVPPRPRWGILSERFASLGLGLLLCRAGSTGCHS